MRPDHASGKSCLKTVRRRAMAIVGFVVALLVIGSFALWVSQLTSATSRSSLSHLYSAGAFYAAESGVEMSLRELNHTPSTDIDSDGTIGTISNDSNTANDPALATGAFYVQKVSTTPVKYRSTGRPVATGGSWTTYRRIIEVRVE